jgi:hypothetical protein
MRRIQELGLLAPAVIILLFVVDQQHRASAFLSPISSSTRRRTASPLFASSSVTDAHTSLSLPELFPVLADSLTALGFSTPTPIQAAAAALMKEQQVEGESETTTNLMLIAPTGSGKTLAYLLPALTKAIQEEGTIMMLAPTRELAVQLLRDAMSLLESLALTDNEGEDSDLIALSIRGIDWPTTMQLERALLLIGTPDELLSAVTNVKGGYDFCASLSAVVLDEVDVLLPLPPKILRTSLDIGAGDKKNNGKNKKSGKDNSPQDERRIQEQRRKLLAAKRTGNDIQNSQIVSSTEKLLNIVASSTTNDEVSSPVQVLAGSATASRKTLDRLNRALRVAAVNEAASTLEQVWGGDIKVCRPMVVDDDQQQQVGDESSPTEQQQHTIRSVLVPEQVKHSFVTLSKEQASSPDVVLATIAKVSQQVLKPKTALLFICGEFAKPNTKAAAAVPLAPKGATHKARRNSRHSSLEDKRKQAAAAKSKMMKSSGEVLSARKACSALATHGITAQPLHVALGLIGGVAAKEEEDDDDDASPSFLVTFEGAARGLHLEGIDCVFVVGRPASAASYLHLAGRVGRSAPSENGEVVVRPGTVVSICTTGSAKELEKWTKQVGAAQSLEEIVL